MISTSLTREGEFKMELAEQITALKAENEAYKQNVEGLNAEKIALDQLFVESLKSSLNIKKELILTQFQIQKRNQEIAVIKSEKEVLQKQFDDYKAEHEPKKLEEVKSEAPLEDQAVNA